MTKETWNEAIKNDVKKGKLTWTYLNTEKQTLKQIIQG